MSRWKMAAAIAALLLVTVPGCAGSRYVGTWTGVVQGGKSSGGGILGDLAAALGQAALGGQATLTLKPGGTGYLKVGSAPEHAITWRADGEKIVLSGTSGAGGETDRSSIGRSDEIVGTLSSDAGSLTLDLGPMSVSLKKQG